MKYAILIVLIALLGYNSVYFEKLSDRNSKTSESFDFATYADSLYTQGLLKAETPIAIDQLLVEVKADQNRAFETYGNRLGIGNSAYFMVSVEGTVAEKTDGLLKVRDKSGTVWPVDTEFIFGNAIRDASRLVKLTDFKTNAEFNALSEALNSIIREEAIPEDLEELRQGDEVTVNGAIKLSKNEDLTIRVVPVQIDKP
ncbi:DUF2291 family protein [Jiulongibacter sediminis]|uniref:Periplasmic lipoprotein n=1 Tax=Jiulongibacter sediminis TaxID=1605367 RepID=A0A0P7C052_9BACT|nr:DUF2291 family protein [Jiulongibacter sediminis]KPM47335.1 hypothetical protein AFM12_16250 [Jiulongibacter sediminis]TBX22892.1 hypothetical protein TK44_16260 [Jiulongibacter sediminis]